MTFPFPQCLLLPRMPQQHQTTQLSLHDLVFFDLRQQRREGCLAMAFSCLPTTLIDLVCVHNWLVVVSRCWLRLHQPGEENQPLKSPFGNLNVTEEILWPSFWIIKDDYKVLFLPVSLNGGTPQTPQNDHF